MSLFRMSRRPTHQWPALALTAVAVLIGWFVVDVSARAAITPPPRVGSLTTEHMTNPLGIDNSHPQLGWVITSAARGISQSKYQIRVAKDVSSLASGQDLVWDSGPCGLRRSRSTSLMPVRHLRRRPATSGTSVCGTTTGRLPRGAEPRVVRDRVP